MKCAECNLREAIVKSDPDGGVQLCDVCRRNFELDDRFARAQVEFWERLEASDFVSASAVLDAAEAQLSPLDQDKWLEEAFALSRGLLLEKQQNWQEALDRFEKCLEPSARRNRDPEGRAFLHSLCATTLAHLGRMAEAESHMNVALDHLERVESSSALPTLVEWFKVGEPAILAARGALVASALRNHGLDPPVDPVADPLGALDWAKDQVQGLA